MATIKKTTGSGTRRPGSDAMRFGAAADSGGPRIHIRNFGTPITTSDRDYLRRKLGTRLARYGDRVERASVRIEDVNGPRGGIDTRCRIKVVLSGMPSVTADELQSGLRIAIDGALSRISAAMRRAVGRRNRIGAAPLSTRAAVGTQSD